MYLSQTNIKKLRDKVENNDGFQIALAPMQPATFIEVKAATDRIYLQLVKAGFSVLVDDRGQKPKNIFKVIEFLGIRHRVVVSMRSLSVGPVEYKDLQTNEFVKVPLAELVTYLAHCIRAV